jgi:superfamily I DNA and/or RNA helicase
MAGDPAQLPPTVTSRDAQQEHQLTLTLFERLQNTLGLETMLLDTQYRMNPAISAFPRYIP